MQIAAQNTSRSENRIRGEPGKSSTRIASVSRKPWRVWSSVCFVALLGALFAQPLLTLVTYASDSQLFSYILLVPFVSAYLLYLRRNELPRIYVADLPLTILCLGIGVGTLAFTYWFDGAMPTPTDSNSLWLYIFSFLCCLAAGGFFFLGRCWMRSAAFPLAYLIFMVPMPEAMSQALETASKFASAEVANVFFHLSGTPFIREGLIFQLPDIVIEVAQECSGIRSSIVLLMTSAVAANLFLKTPWRRFALIVLVIPLAMLRNGFRILVIGLLCVNAGPQMIHSVIHRQGGPVFFLLSLIPFFVVLWWLRRGEVRAEQAE